ncbi:MAG: cell surface protein [Muribaculaceae bacterium]|nr:cell surface protein [Muribaculaceae bacterium]
MKKTIIISSVAPLLACCTAEIPMVNVGIDDSYYISRMSKLPLESALTGNAYLWTVDGTPVSTDRNYIFLAQEEGIYNLTFDIIDESTPYHFEFTVSVLHEEVEYSPYITHVYEYCPAPGQFVNEMPRYEPGDTYHDILQKCEESISGTNDIMITLGSYGGYVTFGFDHTVINMPGKHDFRIWGNAFYELTNPEARGGSAEPGIVMVSYDRNCNGIPDDDWYELAGSEYYKPETLHNYQITYSRPMPGHIPEEDDTGYLDDTIYIPWSDSEGATGYIAKNIFHSQDYFPRWVDGNELTFTGSRLAPNGIDLSGTGRYYVLYAYDYGYVDNHPNDYAELNSFDISTAVDSDGTPVHLPGIDFVRVYTGLNQYCGWLGETSTEIARAQDLHIVLPGIPLPDPLDNK